MTVRLLIVLGIVVAAAASGAPLWALVACLVCAVVAAVRPDTVASTVAVVAVIGTWAAWGPGLSNAVVLLAALGLVVAHVAAHLASLGPSDLRLGRATVTRWATRGAVFAVLATLVWGCLRIAGHWTPSAAWALGAVAALAAGAATFMATRQRS